MRQTWPCLMLYKNLFTGTHPLKKHRLSDFEMWWQLVNSALRKFHEKINYVFPVNILHLKSIFQLAYFWWSRFLPTSSFANQHMSMNTKNFNQDWTRLFFSLLKSCFVKERKLLRRMWMLSFVDFLERVSLEQTKQSVFSTLSVYKSVWFLFICTHSL